MPESPVTGILGPSFNDINLQKGTGGGRSRSAGYALLAPPLVAVSVEPFPVSTCVCLRLLAGRSVARSLRVAAMLPRFALCQPALDNSWASIFSSEKADDLKMATFSRHVSLHT